MRCDDNRIELFIWTIMIILNTLKYFQADLSIFNYYALK